MTTLPELGRVKTQLTAQAKSPLNHRHEPQIDVAQNSWSPPPKPHSLLSALLQTSCSLETHTEKSPQHTHQRWPGEGERWFSEFPSTPRLLLPIVQVSKAMAQIMLRKYQAPLPAMESVGFSHSKIGWQMELVFNRRFIFFTGLNCIQCLVW